MSVEELERALIAWIGELAQPDLPVAVAATDRRVIEVAVRHAERVDLTVGAEPAWLRRAVETAPAAAGERAGGVSLGAFVNVAVHRDRTVARDLVRGSTAILARFATESTPPDGLPAVTREGIAALARDYDESRHGQAVAPAARRLAAFAELGIERLIVLPGFLDADPKLTAGSNAAFAAPVLPALRSVAARML